MPTPTELADQYLAGTVALRKAVAGMTREQLVVRPIAGKWSTLEVVAHLADFDPVLIDRMKRILALGDVPLLLVADENLYIKELGYHDRDVENELAVIESSRKQMAKIISMLRPEQLELTGCHNKRGIVTLEKVIQMAINHIPHHLPFIAEKRKAMGV
ncbi:MAG: DinB family protein [Planctomycetes bacterium]|nr:DinB family protein [Planctomycetota bacterium]